MRRFWIARWVAVPHISGLAIILALAFGMLGQSDLAQVEMTPIAPFPAKSLDERAVNQKSVGTLSPIVKPAFPSTVKYWVLNPLSEPRPAKLAQPQSASSEISHDTADQTNANFRSEWYELQKGMHWFVAGYPNRPGVDLWFEVSASPEFDVGTQRIHWPFADPTDRWQLIDSFQDRFVDRTDYRAMHAKGLYPKVRGPDAKLFVRVCGTVRARRPRDWVAVSQPVRIEPLGWHGFAVIMARWLMTVLATFALFPVLAFVLLQRIQALNRRISFEHALAGTLVGTIGMYLVVGSLLWHLSWLGVPADSLRLLAMAFLFLCALAIQWMAIVTNRTQFGISTWLRFGLRCRTPLFASIAITAWCAIRFAIGVSAPNELFAGVSQCTFVVGDRADPIIPFNVIRMIANGLAINDQRSQAMFHPWTFWERGPVLGLLAAPMVIGFGSDVPIEYPATPWHPTDRTGFWIFRLVSTQCSLLAMWGSWLFARLVFSQRMANRAVWLIASTPFILFDLWVTWPKLFATGVGLLAVVLLLERDHSRQLTGVGEANSTRWLRHLLAIAAIVLTVFIHPVGLLALVGWWIARLIRPSSLRLRSIGTVLVIAISIVVTIRWYVGAPASVFTTYPWRVDHTLTLAPSDFGQQPTRYLSAWMQTRLGSLANTLIPGWQLAVDADHPDLNPLSGSMTWGGRWQQLYWTTVPFAFGLSTWLLMLLRSSRTVQPLVLTIDQTAIKRSALSLLMVIVGFSLLWGYSRAGLMREGLHAVVLFGSMLMSAWLAEQPRQRLRPIMIWRGVEISIAVAAGFWPGS